jgi:hypothetical protein
MDWFAQTCGVTDNHAHNLNQGIDFNEAIESVGIL